MLLYSYKCNNCNERLVTDKPIEEIKEPEIFKCPQCKKDMLKEYTPNFILKGKEVGKTKNFK